MPAVSFSDIRSFHSEISSQTYKAMSIMLAVDSPGLKKEAMTDGGITMAAGSNDVTVGWSSIVQTCR